MFLVLGLRHDFLVSSTFREPRNSKTLPWVSHLYFCAYLQTQAKTSAFSSQNLLYSVRTHFRRIICGSRVDNDLSDFVI